MFVDRSATVVGEFLLVPFTLSYLVICLLFSLENTSRFLRHAHSYVLLLLLFPAFRDSRDPPRPSERAFVRCLSTREAYSRLVVCDTAIDTNGNVFLRPARASRHVHVRAYTARKNDYRNFRRR